MVAKPMGKIAQSDSFASTKMLAFKNRTNSKLNLISLQRSHDFYLHLKQVEKNRPLFLPSEFHFAHALAIIDKIIYQLVLTKSSHSQLKCLQLNYSKID